MTTTDYLINALFIGLVVLQVRGKRLTTLGLVLPLAVVAWVASQYLHTVPTAGNDLALIVVGVGAGLALGIGCAMATSLTRTPDGDAFAKAGLVAAVLWVLGIGARLAFTLYASHGGQRAIAHFSLAHHITSGQAWVSCLILMAVAEVVGRSAVLAQRRRTLLASRNESVRSGGPVASVPVMMGAGDYGS
jgi:hypothetical protein